MEDLILELHRLHSSIYRICDVIHASSQQSQEPNSLLLHYPQCPGHLRRCPWHMHLHWNWPCVCERAQLVLESQLMTKSCGAATRWSFPRCCRCPRSFCVLTSLRPFGNSGTLIFYHQVFFLSSLYFTPSTSLLISLIWFWNLLLRNGMVSQKPTMPDHSVIHQQLYFQLSIKVFLHFSLTAQWRTQVHLSSTFV